VTLFVVWSGVKFDTSYKKQRWRSKAGCSGKCDWHEPMKEEVIGAWKKLHNEELHGVYSSINKLLFFSVSQQPAQSHALSVYRGSHYGDQFKDFELRGECGTHFGKEMHTELCFGNLKLRDHSWDLSVDGKVKLQFILKK